MTGPKTKSANLRAAAPRRPFYQAQFSRRILRGERSFFVTDIRARDPPTLCVTPKIKQTVCVSTTHTHTPFLVKTSFTRSFLNSSQRASQLRGLLLTRRPLQCVYPHRYVGLGAFVQEKNGIARGLAKRIYETAEKAENMHRKKCQRRHRLCEAIGLNLRIRFLHVARKPHILAGLASCAGIIALLLLYASSSFSRIPPAADPWKGIADVGPASSPEAWQAMRPPVLIISYAYWPGVYSAASAQGLPVLGLPGSASAAQAQQLVDLIARTPSLRAVVVHGIPWGSLAFARLLRAQIPLVRIFFVYHGAPSAPFHSAESGLVKELIDAENEGVVDAIGAVKVGFAETLKHFGARRTFTVPNFPAAAASLPSSKYSTKDGRVHIGVFASNDALHKNVATQLVAACSVEGAIVHVTFLPTIAYLKGCEIVVTGFLSHSRFLSELSRMDVLSYVTLTECYPMIVLEAAAAGVPVVVSRTHHIFDSDPFLVSALAVAEADSPGAIAAKLSGAAADSSALRPRLLHLTTCLRHEAERAWNSVLELSPEEARRAQLYTWDGEAPCSSYDAAAPSSAAADDHGADDSSASLLHVAFLTYELSPVTPGGAGVVISNLVEELLEAGHKVTVLAYMQESVLTEWTRLMNVKGWSNVGPGRKLFVHHVPTLVRETDLDGQGPNNIFLRRSWLFALAAQAAYSIVPFDAVEAFDYVGSGFELTRRLADWRDATARGDSALAPEPYLPKHVLILVRLHGTLQLIHQQEGIFAGEGRIETPRPCHLSDNEREAWPLMYLMEQYTLQAAHLVLAQSLAMKKVYSQAYGISEGRMLLSPPPMTRITLPFKDMARAEPEKALSSSNHVSEFRLLVYGRVMRVKGAETVAAASEMVFAALPTGTVLHLIYAGLDWDCPLHKRLTSQCVRTLLPSNVRGTFSGPLDRNALRGLLPSVHGAIFASEFETFGLAAHEIAATNIPIVISDIDAYAEFFSTQNSYVFSTGNATSLSNSILALFADVINDTSHHVDLKYTSSRETYMHIAVRQIKSPPALRLLTAAFLQGSYECFFRVSKNKTHLFT